MEELRVKKECNEEKEKSTQKFSCRIQHRLVNIYALLPACLLRSLNSIVDQYISQSCSC